MSSQDEGQPAWWGDTRLARSCSSLGHTNQNVVCTEGKSSPAKARNICMGVNVQCENLYYTFFIIEHCFSTKYKRTKQNSLCVIFLCQIYLIQASLVIRHLWYKALYLFQAGVPQSTLPSKLVFFMHPIYSKQVFFIPSYYSTLVFFIPSCLFQASVLYAILSFPWWCSLWCHFC